MQDFFVGPKDACEATLELLEDLTDGNYLKPEMWVEHKKCPENHCGFSLGVRSFVRPLYVHSRLREIRKHGDNGVKLGDLNVYHCVDRKSFKRNPTLAKTKSKYKRRGNGRPRRKTKPCKSCEIFFDYPSTLSSRPFDRVEENQRRLGVFGNCAEYDVIKTRKLNYLLRSIGDTSWRDFESACEKHLKAFNDLTTKTSEKHDPYVVLKEYFERVREPKIAKVLKYEWNSQSNSYRLQAMDWEPEKSV